MTSIPDITLNNGQTIPQFGFGVFQIEPKETVAAVSTALEAGYRHIDTAEMYGNEAEVGRGHRQLGPGPRRGLRHQQAEQRLRTSPTRPAGPSKRRSRRSAPSTSTCS